MNLLTYELIEYAIYSVILYIYPILLCSITYYPWCHVID